MVETRASGPVEEGEEESVQDLEAEIAELAVERAKKKAARDMEKLLPARMSTKKRKAVVANAA